MDRAKATAWGLALAGLVPFAGCAIMVATGAGDREVWLEALIAYAAIILSFLGGARWGRALAEPVPDASTLILSNLPAVAAWLTYLPSVPDTLQVGVLIAGLVAMLIWDWRSSPGWYRTLRLTASAGAVLSLGIVLVALQSLVV
jgi:hypothetical protein